LEASRGVAEVGAQTHAEVEAEAHLEGVRGRAVLWGFVVVVIVNVWITYAGYVLHSYSLNITNFSIALLSLFLGLLVGNRACRRVRPASALSPAELFTILIMGLVGSVIPSRGLTGIFLGALASPYYLATPENRWAEFLHDSIPGWMTPPNTNGAMQWLFEGLPEGMPIPWGLWVMPLLWWCLLIGAGFLVCASIVVILRRQWVEHERLVYPLLHPIIDLATDGQEGRPSLFRNRLFWAGFAISGGIISWNILNYFNPTVPRINMSPNAGLFYFAQYFPPLLTHLNTYTIGFGYFVNLEVLFSLWFFHLFLLTQNAVFRRMGFYFGSDHKGGGAYSDPVIQWQCAGALFAFVVVGLYVGRRHLGDVFRRAFRGDAAVEDRDEFMSCRAAVFCLIGGLAFIAGWLMQSGMELRMIALFLPAALITYIALAKFVCESGTLYLGAPISPQDFALQIFGSRSFSASSITATAFSSCLSWMLFTTPLSMGAKLADLVRGDRRRLFWAIWLALLSGLAVNIALTIYYGYTYGAYNFYDYPFVRYAPNAFNNAVTTLQEPYETSWPRIAFFGIGGAVVALLMLMRYRFPAWPFHPVGFIVATTSILHEILSLFIVWSFKAIVTRVGGVALYRRFRPLFIGIIVGRAFGVTLSFVVDTLFFPGQGHYVHGWV